MPNIFPRVPTGQGKAAMSFKELRQSAIEMRPVYASSGVRTAHTTKGIMRTGGGRKGAPQQATAANLPVWL